MQHFFRWVLIPTFLMNSLWCSAQTKVVKDTITLMHYNILMYGAGGSACATFSTDLTFKDTQLKTIVEYIQPDILTLNELDCKAFYVTRIQQNCFKDLPDSYVGAVMQDKGGQNLCNGLIYNSDKLGLIKSSGISKEVGGSDIIRTIDIHTLYLKGKYLEEGQDTVKFDQLIAHLKASQGTANVNQRAAAAEGVMDYLENNRRVGNYVLSGDFNMYRASEQGYQNFTDYSNSAYNFIDPIQQEGSWNNNSAYAAYHTQSTRDGNCGGMDDRFDMILASDDIINNGKQLMYIPGSYRAVGQDGNRLNGNVKTPTNTDVPTDIVNALFDLSDHLPVTLKMEASTEVLTSIEDQPVNWPFVQVINAGNEPVEMRIHGYQEEELKVSIYSIQGKQVLSELIEIRNEMDSHFFNLESGLYVLQISNSEGFTQAYKVIAW